MTVIKGAQGGGSGHIVAAYLGPGFIDITVKYIPVPVKECAALDVYAIAGEDDVSEPPYFISTDMGDDIESMFIFPSMNIIFGNVGNHVNVTAGAALTAVYGGFFFHWMLHEQK
jgi:hypothetical protein